VNELEFLELLKKSDLGDSAAYELLLKEIQHHSLKVVRLQLRFYKNFPVEMIHDIVQDILVTFHETHQSFDRSRPITPWINTVIKHKTIDFLRKKDFRVQMSAAEWSQLLLESSNSSDDSISLKELLDQIGKLSPEYQKIIELAKIEGLSMLELSKRLTLSESNAKVTLHRALKTLDSLLNKIYSR